MSAAAPSPATGPEAEDPSSWDHGSDPRLGRLESAAMAAVIAREVVMFKRYWRATTFSSIVQPVIYLLAFGLGFGSLVHRVGHLGYVQYVATGVVATAVLFSSAFPGMFNTFIRWKFQRTYDALLAAPIDVEELITAETLWIAIRSGVYGVAPLIVGFFWGLTPKPAMLLVPLVGFVTGFGFANFGVLIAAVAKTIDNFNYVTSAVLTPMFLVAGTFFPITQLPGVLRDIAQVNPLYHCVALVRDLALQSFHAADFIHIAVLVVFAVLLWRLAVWRMQQRLVD